MELNLKDLMQALEKLTNIEEHVFSLRAANKLDNGYLTETYRDQPDGGDGYEGRLLEDDLLHIKETLQRAVKTVRLAKRKAKEFNSLFSIQRLE